MVILRIATLNHAAYEWIQHVKEGLSTGQLKCHSECERSAFITYAWH